jgi:hypothetical protein
MLSLDMDEPSNRRRWSRVTLTLPPTSLDDLRDLAAANYRAPREEALRLLIDGIRRERRRSDTRTDR